MQLSLYTIVVVRRYGYEEGMTINGEDEISVISALRC